MYEKIEIYELNLTELSRFFLKRSRILALAALLCAGLSLLGSLLLLGHRYESQITFCVCNGGASPEAGITSADLALSRDLVGSCMVILHTRETLTAVISQTRTAQTWKDLRGMIQGEVLNDTEFFQITVISPNAWEANVLAAAVGEILPRRVSDILTGISLKTVDTPVAADRPSYPDYLLITLLGGLGGAILGAVWTMWEALRRKDILSPLSK